MIFFVDNNGKIINSQPETVYQGAADTNNIYLIAPFAANLSFAVAFRLPNGAYTERYLMTNGGQLEGVEYPKTGNRYALWRLSIPNNITQYYGTVHAQFYAYATDSAITATSSTTFVVSQGVPEILPDTPTQDIYNQILTVLSQLQAQLNNGVFAARAIYWWIDTYVYGMNEITFYPLGEYGAFVRSIVTENEGNEPYDEEGNLNSEYWQELVDFNKIIQALEDAVKAAEEAAESAENAAESAEASAESAEEAKNFADSAAASADDAAKSAEEAAQSASDAAASAESAAESAYDAAVSEGNAAQSAIEAAEAAEKVTDYLSKTTEFVDELPETGDEDKLYFVAGEENNLYTIYIWKDGEWVKLGETNLVLNNTNIYISVLTISGWVENSQTLTLTGLTADDGVCVYPAKGYSSKFVDDYDIEASEVIDDGIVFTCTTTPTENIPIIVSVTKQQEIPTATGYYTKPETDALFAAEADLYVDHETYIITLTLKAKDGTVLASPTIDLPLESVVVDGSYDNDSQTIILTLQNGNTVSVPVGDLIEGLATKADLDNINADTIYFTKDLVFTKQFGKYTPDSSGSVTIPTLTDKMSVQSLFENAFSEEANPTVTQPSGSVILSNSGYYEVGTEFTPSYRTTFSAGSYEYGPTPTGVEVTSYSISDTNDNTSTEASGTFPTFTIGDGTNYRVFATIAYSEGDIPLTNLGNEYAAGQIPAGTISVNSSYAYGYRSTFYGTMTSKPDIMTSDDIRALASNARAQAATLSVSVPVGAYRIVIAVPNTYQVTSIKDVNGLNAEIFSSFTQTTIDVEGANGYTATSYNVYYLDYANANDTANTYTVTVAAA